MNIITKVIKRLNKQLTKMELTGAPRFFLLTFAALFLFVGVLYIGGLVLELVKEGKVNYKAIVDFIDSYFSMSAVAAFGVIGKALVDADNDGKPDVWKPVDEAKK